MKISRVINACSWIGAVVLAINLSGCALTEKTEQQNNLDNKVAVEFFSNQAIDLIEGQYIADSGTLSLIDREDPSLVLTAISRHVLAKLRDDGYAVQIVLPPEKRQKGDVDEMKLNGQPLAFNLTQLQGSDYVEFAVIVGSSRYAKVFKVQGLTITSVSNWMRLNAEENLIRLEDL